MKSHHITLPRNRIKSPMPLIVATCSAFDHNAFHALEEANKTN